MLTVYAGDALRVTAFVPQSVSQALDTQAAVTGRYTLQLPYFDLIARSAPRVVAWNNSATRTNVEGTFQGHGATQRPWNCSMVRRRPSMV